MQREAALRYGSQTADDLLAWLCPDASNLVQQYAVLDDRERPYFEHLMAA